MTAHLKRILDVACLILTAWFFAAFFYVCARRQGYPYMIEWMEGGILQQAQYFLDFGRVYPEPSLDHLPYIYSPLYVYLSSLIATVTDPGLATLRLLSIASTLVTCSMIGAIAYEISRSRLAAWLGAGLYVAAFRYTAFSMDIARLDSFFLALTFTAVYFHLRSPVRARYAVFAGVLYFLAAFCKQTGLIILVVLPLGLLSRLILDRTAWRSDTLCAGIALGATLVAYSLLFAWEPFASWYLFEVPRSHQAPYGRVCDFLRQDIGGSLPGLAALSVLCIFARDSKVDGRTRWFLVLLGGGGVVASLLPRIKDGGWNNNLMPMGAAMAVLGATAVGLHGQRRTRPCSTWLGGLTAGLVLVQFWRFFYDPRSQIPPEEAFSAAEDLVARIGAIDGEVFAPAHGYLNVLTRKGHGYAHLMPYWDIKTFPEYAGRIDREIETAIRSRRFAALLDAAGALDRFVGLLRENYVEAPVPDHFQSLRSLTGMGMRPGSLWLRRAPGAPPPRWRIPWPRTGEVLSPHWSWISGPSLCRAIR